MPKIIIRLILLLVLWPMSAHAAATTYQVQKVYDGDTILLNNGQKVRFLGINTPEVAGRGKPAQSGGEQAKHWLQQLEQQTVSLEIDVEVQDKYGRQLAYVYSADQRFINLELVKAGLASVSIFPPNLKHTAALLAAQQSAEQARLGIWADPTYAPLAYGDINPDNSQGWKRITGQITVIKHNHKNTYLQFSPQVAVQIAHQYADLFPDWQSYLGKTIEARGWLHKSGHRYTILLRHPGEIKLLQP